MSPRRARERRTTPAGVMADEFAGRDPEDLAREFEPTSQSIRNWVGQADRQEAGFHAWRHRPPSAHSVADTMLLKRVRTIHTGSRETYGAPRVHAQLHADGGWHGRKRIARMMRTAGLVGASRRRTGVTTTRRRKDARPAPDLVDRRRFASQVEAKMACFSFIESWYNPVRLHSALGYRSPMAYEVQMKTVTTET